MTDHAQRAHFIVEGFRQDDSEDYDAIYAHVKSAIEKALDEVSTQAHAAGMEEASKLHDSVKPYCDHEPEAGAGAMGAVLRYRDLIRAKAKKADHE